MVGGKQNNKISERDYQLLLDIWRNGDPNVLEFIPVTTKGAGYAVSTVVAMANSYGGLVFIGASVDLATWEVKVEGCGKNLHRLRDFVEGIIKFVRPPLVGSVNVITKEVTTPNVQFGLIEGLGRTLRDGVLIMDIHTSDMIFKRVGYGVLVRRRNRNIRLNRFASKKFREKTKYDTQFKMALVRPEDRKKENVLLKLRENLKNIKWFSSESFLPLVREVDNRFGRFPKWHVFLSYCQEDEKWVEGFEKVFEQLGLEVWRDERSILPAEELSHSIIRGLSGCLAGIVVISRNANQSDWVRGEVNLLLQREGVYGERFPILPVLKDNENILKELKHLRAFDARQYQEWGPHNIEDCAERLQRLPIISKLQKWKIE